MQFLGTYLAPRRRDRESEEVAMGLPELPKLENDLLFQSMRDDIDVEQYRQEREELVKELTEKFVDVLKEYKADVPVAGKPPDTGIRHVAKRFAIHYANAFALGIQTGIKVSHDLHSRWDQQARERGMNRMEDAAPERLPRQVARANGAVAAHAVMAEKRKTMVKAPKPPKPKPEPDLLADVPNLTDDQIREALRDIDEVRKNAKLGQLTTRR